MSENMLLNDKIEKNAQFILFLIFILQILLFHSYISREVAWDSILFGDPTWYNYFSYNLFYSITVRDWNSVYELARTSPWGFLPFLQSAIFQFILGSSRYSLVFINLFYYLISQLATYLFFSYITKSKHIGLFFVLIFLTLNTPFRTDGPALNIRDFHFDLNLFFLLIIVFYLVGYSKVFMKRRETLYLALFMAFVVSMRLVSIFIFIAGFFVITLWIMASLFSKKKNISESAKKRIYNILLGIVVFSICSFPALFVARNAVYSQYFRFIFEPDFAALKAPLYQMGQTDKLSQAILLMEKTFISDIGYPFWILVAIISIQFMIHFFLRGRIQTHTLTSEIDNFFHDKIFYKLYLIFLLSFSLVNYFQHLSFVIKSDHLTRATSAPLLVFVFIMLLPLIKELSFNNRYLRYVNFILLISMATFVQSQFYTNTGRLNGQKKEILDVNAFYEDLYQIINKLNIDQASISVDFTDNYSLGGILAWNSFVWEHHGKLIRALPGLGHHPDDLYNLDQAIEFLESSDVFLFSGLNSDKKVEVASQFPMEKSIAEYRYKLGEYAKKNFEYCGSYNLFGHDRDLYVKTTRPNWIISASESTESRYGPEKLIGSQLQIWHAPWGKGPQWVKFSTSKAVKPEKLTIAAQDGGIDRAPKTFNLQGSDDGTNWIDLMEFKDVRWGTKLLEWDLSIAKSYPNFRLYVYDNNGSDSLLTIQKVSLHIKSEKTSYCSLNR